MMIAARAAIYANEALEPNDFFRQEHASVFEIIRQLLAEKQAVDLLTVMSRLRAQEKLEEAGGPGYVARLIDGVPASANIEYYCRALRDLRVKRECLAVADKMTIALKTAERSGVELLSEAEEWLGEVAKAQGGSALLTPEESSGRFLEEIDRRLAAKGGLVGVPSGFPALDDITCGFQQGNLSIVAARPSVGKSALLACIALAAASQGRKVAYFSLEMSSEELDMRLVSLLANVTLYRLQHGMLASAEHAKVSAAIEQRAKLPIFIDPTEGISAPQVRAKARHMQTRFGLDLIIVDYLQLATGGGQYESRQLEVADISRTLLGTAKSLRVPVLAASQLSRAGQDRKDTKPRLSDLRESGALEQDSHVVLALHREDYTKHGPTDLMVLKNRNGSCGEVGLLFDGNYTRFTQAHA